MNVVIEQRILIDWNTLSTSLLPVTDVLAIKGMINRKDICDFLFLSFRRVLNVIYSFLGNSPASEL